MNGKVVGSHRSNTSEPLFLLEQGGSDVDEARLKDGLYLRLGFSQFVVTVGVYGEIQTDIKNLFLRLLKAVA